jgi:large subunit ribosomal protein L17
MASALFLTERDATDEDNAPKHKGRIVTTISKAKEIRPLVERCITIAKRALDAQDDASQHATTAERNTDAWRNWRKGEDWQKWAQAIAPAVNARRRALRLLGDKQAVRILFNDIAPRFRDRTGGYTRIVRLAGVRLGDGGQKAILELVGVRDRAPQHSVAPTIESDAK